MALLGLGALAIGLGVLRRRRVVVAAGAAGVLSGVGLALLLGSSASYVDQIEACGPLSDHWPVARGQCVVTYGTAALAEQDVLAALAPLQESETCHDVGHELGRRAGSLLPSLRDALIPEAAVCQEGFIHGVLYAAAMYLDDAQYRELALEACRAWQGQADFSMPSCAHGIGHGALFRWSGDIQAANDMCLEAFTDQEHDLLVECRGGAMSAWASLQALAPAGPAYPVSSGQELTATCAQLSEPELAHECYAGLAMSARPQPGQEFETFAGLLEVCSRDSTDQYFVSACTSGVAKAAQEWYAGSADGARACAVVPPGRGRTMCAIGYALSQQYDAPQRSDTRLVCDLAEVPWADCEVVLGVVTEGPKQ